MLKNKILRFRRNAILFNIMHWICVVTPFIVLFAIKNKDWIKTKDDAISFTVGAILCFIVLVMVIAKKVGKFGVIGWYIVIALISYFFKMIAQDLTLICLCGLGGYIIASVFLVFSKRSAKKYDDYKKALVNSEVLRSSEIIELDKNGNIK